MKIGWKKVILTVLAILFVVIPIAIGAWWYVDSTVSRTASNTASSSAKTDPRKDWEVYVNDKWNFAFKYPPGKTCDKLTEKAADQIEKSKLELYFTETDCKTLVFEIFFSVIPKDFNYLTSVFAEEGEAKFTDSLQKINGATGTARAYKYDEKLERKGQNGVVIQLEGKNNRYLISTVFRPDLKKPFTDVEVELIIKSFKILEP